MTDTNAIATIKPEDAALAAEAATIGDLQGLKPDQRAALYGAVCRSVGLNPLTQPFQYIKLNGKLTLYAAKTATDQLRKVNGISITQIEKEIVGGVLMVTAYAQDKTGRTDSDVGAVPIGNLQGEALANAHMKAITKAKRRVTLSIAGLGWLDESEVESIPAQRAQPIRVDIETGEIQDAPTTREDSPGRAERPAPVSSVKSLGENAQEPNTDAEWASLNASLHAKVPHDLLHDLAVNLWKKGSWSDMSVRDLKQVQRFLDGNGPEAKQGEFDQYVDAWEATRADDADEDGVIEAEVVEQGGFNELIPDEDDLPTPAHFHTR